MSRNIGPKRVIVDASHTYGSGLNSGVQRVVRNVSLLNRNNAESSSIASVLCRKGRWWQCDLANERDSSQNLNRWKTSPVAMMPRSYRSLARLVCKLMPFQLARKWLLPEPGHLGAFKVPLTVYSNLVAAAERKSETEIGAGDLLLLPDAYWAKEEIWPCVQRAKDNGAKVAVVLYDLIPLTHPQFVSSKAALPFRDYLRQVAKHADMVIAISDTVRTQVEQLFSTAEYKCNDDCRFASFELGAEFQQKKGKVRDHVSEVFPSDAVNAPHLMVATFDPRKNHNFVLDAFEEVWQEYPNRKLCFIGRVGWLCQDVIDRIRQHPRFGKQLFALHDATDVELHYCYQRARSVLMPSIVEGFGLPIVEALWHQRHVFASSTEIHREVGRDQCEYFDLDSPQRLAGKITQWEASHGDVSPRKASESEPVSWEQSIASLIDQCKSQLFPGKPTTEKQAA